jgi:hypothetical protein
MSRFGRKETFISSHYTHGYQTAPLAFHHLQPLTYGPYMAYGDLGYNPLDLVRARKWIRTLRETGANTAVYDLYDAVSDLSSDYSWKTADIKSLKAYAAMSTLAANNSSAYLKTAYWIKLAGLIMVDQTLLDSAKSRADTGYNLGEKDGSAKISSDITTLYKQALELVEGRIKAKNQPVSANLRLVLDNLKKGVSSADVKARVTQAQKDETAVAGSLPVDKGGTKQEEEAKCEDTWWGKVPGYCTSQRAYTYAAYGVGALTVLGTAFWAWGKYRQASKANPYGKLRSNPSAPGVMGDEPELEIARLPAAKKQEKNLANTTFRMEKK